MTAVPSHALPHRTPAQLLALARQGLAESISQPDGVRYASAHLAALRAAAAVLAHRARPTRERGRVPSVWVLLAQIAPEYTDWIDHFVSTATTRAAADAGIPRVVTARQADDMLNVARRWVELVAQDLGVPA